VHINTRVSIHHSAIVHRAVSHQVAVQQLSRQRLQAAILQSLQDRKIIELAESVLSAIGFTPSTRTVFLSAERHRHILERRQLSNQIHADIAANRIAEALSDVRLKRQLPRRPDVREVIGFVESAGMHVLVALKQVSAARTVSQSDELWIQTAFPVGSKRLRKWRATKEFVHIDAA
jgi:hypothetical protein